MKHTKTCISHQAWDIPDACDCLGVHYSSGKDDWETPDDLFDIYNTLYHFVLDAAANGVNHKCPMWYGPDSPIQVYDALEADWGPHLEKGNIWLNPPYSRSLQSKFIEKVVREVHPSPHVHLTHNVVALLPSRTDTRLFHEWVKPWALHIEFLKGRIKFVGGKSVAPFPSMIVVF